MPTRLEWIGLAVLHVVLVMLVIHHVRETAEPEGETVFIPPAPAQSETDAGKGSGFDPLYWMDGLGGAIRAGNDTRRIGGYGVV